VNNTAKNIHPQIQAVVAQVVTGIMLPTISSSGNGLAPANVSLTGHFRQFVDQRQAIRPLLIVRLILPRFRDRGDFRRKWMPLPVGTVPHIRFPLKNTIADRLHCASGEISQLRTF
jgi:hypothetical protein